MNFKIRTWKSATRLRGQARRGALLLVVLFLAWMILGPSRERGIAQIFRNADQVLNASFDSTNSAVKISFASTDPCLSPNIAKKSKAVTATGEQVALVSGQTVYVCSFTGTFGGTNPTATFQYGTGTNCGTGTVNLSGAIAPSPNGTPLNIGFGGTVMSTAASNALCIALGGTSPTVAGLLTYVQQ